MEEKRSWCMMFLQDQETTKEKETLE